MPNLDTMRGTRLGFDYLDIDNQREPFNKLEVRQALQYALDRDEFLAVCTSGLGQLIAPVPPALKDYALDPKSLPGVQAGPEQGEGAAGEGRRAERLQDLDRHHPGVRHDGDGRAGAGRPVEEGRDRAGDQAVRVRRLAGAVQHAPVRPGLERDRRQRRSGPAAAGAACTRRSAATRTTRPTPRSTSCWKRARRSRTWRSARSTTPTSRRCWCRRCRRSGCSRAT